MPLQDANDSTVSNPIPIIVPQDFVTATDPFLNAQSSVRVSQQDILPNAAKSKFVSVVQQVPGTTVLSSVVPDGSSVIFRTVTTNPQGNRVLQVIGRQVYIGSRNATSRMPEVISSNIYPHYDWPGALDEKGVSIVNQPGKAVWNTQVRNSSGSSQAIFLEIVTRYIVNNSDQAANN